MISINIWLLPTDNVINADNVITDDQHTQESCIDDILMPMNIHWWHTQNLEVLM